MLPDYSGCRYRWAVWSTYGQAHGTWYADNNNTLFAGVHPSNWGNGNQSAHHISSNADYLRNLFTRRGPTIGSIKSSVVYAEEWYSYSSTNSRHAAALFRVRNNTKSAIKWNVYWYGTGYGGWNEYRGAAMNGSNHYYSSGNFGPSHQLTTTFNVPANRTSTIIFVAASSSQSGTRSCFLAFYNNCLVLPNGLEFVDDLDTKPNGWNN